MIEKAKREDPWVECLTCGGTAKVHEVKAEWCESWNEDYTGNAKLADHAPQTAKEALVDRCVQSHVISNPRGDSVTFGGL